MTTSTYSQSTRQIQLRDLLNDLISLKERVQSSTEEEMASLMLDWTNRDGVSSIQNLFNYIVMRREDLRPLQLRLADHGLSSLGRGEQQVLGNIDRVIDILSRAVLHQPYQDKISSIPVANDFGHRLIRQRAAKLFGNPPATRSEYIMVTMPADAASNMSLLENLVAGGMDTARINCAHDNKKVWHSMIENIRHVSRCQNKEIRILMDLKGHKIRINRVVSNEDKSIGSDKKPPRVFLYDHLVLSQECDDIDWYQERFNVPIKLVVGCTFPDVLDRLNRDETVWIDDGKIGTVIKGRDENALLLQVNRVGPKGARVKKEKGLNFPQATLDLPPLSRSGLDDLKFICKYADMVGLSFTERPEDVLYLKDRLRRIGKENLPIIAKIESRHAVQRLPDIIAVSMANNIDLGIMLARGDLAIELGSVRMAEIQEEILWVCEAAHVPVIWATQVFESLSKKGVASRPEITDAAMSVRADCVMLNKGPYIHYAVSVLGDILKRMEAHQDKKFSRLRALHW